MPIRGHRVWRGLGLIGLQLACATSALAQSFGLDLDCAEDTTAYKGTARGTLTTTARNSSGELVLSGELDISIREWEEPARSEHVNVEGTLWKDGRMGQLHVRSSNSLSATEIWIQPTQDWGSLVRISLPSGPSNERDYSMNCSASHLRLPQIRNLVVSRDRAYAIVPPGAAGSSGNYLYVANDGNAPITLGPIRVRVAGRVISSQLRPSNYGDTTIPP